MKPLDGGEQLVDQKEMCDQEKRFVKKRCLLKETDSSAGAH
jgi:hypothetical protein